MRKLISLLLLLMLLPGVTLAQDGEEFTGIDGMVTVTVPEEWQAFGYEEEIELRYAERRDSVNYQYSLYLSLLTEDVLLGIGLEGDTDPEEFVEWFRSYWLYFAEDVEGDLSETQVAALGDNTLTYVSYSITVTYDEGDVESMTGLYGYLDVAGVGKMLVQTSYETTPNRDLSRRQELEEQAIAIVGTVRFTDEADELLTYEWEAGGLQFEHPVGWEIDDSFEEALDIEVIRYQNDTEIEFAMNLRPLTPAYLEVRDLPQDVDGPAFVEWSRGVVEDIVGQDNRQTVEAMTDVETMQVGSNTLTLQHLQRVTTHESGRETVLIHVIGLLETPDGLRISLNVTYSTYPDHDAAYFDALYEQALDLLGSLTSQ